MHYFKFLFTVLVVLAWSFKANAQNEQILCTDWCKAANQTFESEFSQGNCLYIIELTPQGQVVFTGWCNSLASISKARSITYSATGDILQSLYNPNGWIESSYLTGNEELLYHSLENTYPECANTSLCSTEIEMIQGVECILAKVLATGHLLYLKEFSTGIDGTTLTVGTKATIGYVSLGGPTFCLQGDIPVQVTCLEIENGNGDFDICTGFEEYSIGNIIPQGNPLFTLFSGQNNQNGLIVNSISSSGNKSLKFSNGSDIDFNISRTITEQNVARIGWKMYLPKGKSGVIGLETNNAQNYALVMEFNEENVTIYSATSGTLTKVAGPNYIGADRWVTMAIIFQPFENEIEFWADHFRICTLNNYQSNKIEDLNIFGINNLQNTEFYIDELCYIEWRNDGPCTAQYAPVCIGETEFSNSCYASNNGYTDEEYYDGSCDVPTCPTISYPANGAQNVPTDFLLSWSPGERVQTYDLVVTEESTNELIINKILEKEITSYPLGGLSQNKSYYIEIYSINSTGFGACTFSTFKTLGSSVSLPPCAVVTYPSANTNNIPTTVNMSWIASPTATGYRLRMGTQVGGSDLLNNIDIGNVTNYLMNNLPSGTQICFTVIPYNAAGQNLNCSNTCFRTVSISSSEETTSTSKVFIYPVPAREVLNVWNMEKASYTIMDISSKVLVKGTLESNNEIPVDDLPTGFYVIHLRNDQKTYIFKFQKI
ncbi:MAG: T9SS type A sorting domain-containing protein [Lewinellaceae bacterium]|nr:T9SS type A sorting domain-containing protein [Lewinellaceae bacterium]